MNISSKPKLLIVGMTNVGKSSLFNYLSRKRIAIVSEFPRTTVDSIHNIVQINGEEWDIIDSAGFEKANLKEEIYIKSIKRVEAELEIADFILFIVNSQARISDKERELSKLLKKTKKKVILVINKVDSSNYLSSMSEYAALGIPDRIEISLKNRINLDKLKELISENYPASEFKKDSTRNQDVSESINQEDQEIKDQNTEESLDRIVIVGRPNVGKSSLFNALLEKERSVVADKAGTTRDSIDSQFKLGLSNLTLSDTAGRRRRSKINDILEYWSLDRADLAVKNADIVLLVLDGTDLIARIDKRICQEIIDLGKSLIIVINKWDIASNDLSIKEAIGYLESNYAFLPWIKVTFISALLGDNLDELRSNILEAFVNRKRILNTKQLNSGLLPVISNNKPLNRNHKKPVIKYIAQLSASPPTFVIKGRNTEVLSVQYLKFIEKTIRSLADFAMTPIKFKN